MLGYRNWEGYGAARDGPDTRLRDRRGAGARAQAELLQREEMDLLTDEMMDTFAITGKWGELPQIVKDRYQADTLIDRINYYIPYVPDEDDEGWPGQQPRRSQRPALHGQRRGRYAYHLRSG